MQSWATEIEKVTSHPVSNITDSKITLQQILHLYRFYSSDDCHMLSVKLSHVLFMCRVLCNRYASRRFIKYSVLEKDQSFAIGDELHGYTVDKIVPVSELSLTAIHLQHRSGAQHLHISRQDSNNVFGFVV